MTEQKAPKNPAVSAIMLTYNREALAPRAIESVLAQTFRDFEFVIVDNGSSDGSGAVADGYAARDGRLRVIHRERGGIGAGRNAGLGAARGEYIAFIDDDDWCEPDYLEFLLGLAEGRGADVAICGATKWEGGASAPVGIADKPVLLDAENAIIELLRRRRYGNGLPAKLFKRRLFAGKSFPRDGRYEDIHMAYRLLAGAGRVASYGLPKYNVFRHGGNNSAATAMHGMIDAQFLGEYRAVYRERTAWLCERFPGSSARWRYFDWSFQISMVEKIVRHGLAGCEAHLAEMRLELAENRAEFLDAPWTLDFEREWMGLYI